jgi:nitrite reductase (NADH) small subunit
MGTSMATVRVADLTSLPPESVLQAEHSGRAIVLCNHQGVIYAYDGLCPHSNGPLGQGNLDNGHIVCPWHAWAFNCQTGAYDFNPLVRLEQFAVHVENGGIYVEIP